MLECVEVIGLVIKCVESEGVLVVMMVICVEIVCLGVIDIE